MVKVRFIQRRITDKVGFSFITPNDPTAIESLRKSKTIMPEVFEELSEEIELPHVDAYIPKDDDTAFFGD